MVVGKEVLRAEPSSSTSSVFCCRPRERSFVFFCLLSLSSLSFCSSLPIRCGRLSSSSSIFFHAFFLGSWSSDPWPRGIIAWQVWWFSVKEKKWQLLFLELSLVFLCFAFLWIYFSVGKRELCFSTFSLSSFWVNLLFFSDSVTFSVAPPFLLFFSLFFFLGNPLLYVVAFRLLSCILV